MVRVSSVDEVEIHPTDAFGRLFEVILYGDDVHFDCYANVVEFESGVTNWRDPKSEWSDWFSYITFEEPVVVTVEDDYVGECFDGGD